MIVDKETGILLSFSGTYNVFDLFLKVIFHSHHILIP